eukprot:TRINITY_DN8635_c0_g1_i1.p1 TRINITY_DN8635_c0_g1~~TRINITY_DN8635_c0_g1_i1.p1  ORF type:complete len:53 (-),score=9.31 TRINITY_DN8635_c0_g1_i1:29-187(-)
MFRVFATLKDFLGISRSRNAFLRFLQNINTFSEILDAYKIYFSDLECRKCNF